MEPPSKTNHSDFEIQDYLSSRVKKSILFLGVFFRFFFIIGFWSVIWEKIGAWEAFFDYFQRENICYRDENGNFEWAYLKSSILDIMTGNKKFWSLFQPEWLGIYRIHCAICMPGENGGKIQNFKYTQMVDFALWLHIIMFFNNSINVSMCPF